MDDRTYLLGKLAALECALEAAIATHPAPGALTLALCKAMANTGDVRRGADFRAYADGWLAVVSPLLGAAAARAHGLALRCARRGIH
ncbi:hypothetical protein [Luteibacter yeojuensis]|uniref:Uncharacterized protein n=1 Tax=Luteibacter yeojuensis TaxID=345309 RepID=A0A0F3KYA5_9GAMM|nr:hypothetical protein [Luteibacter yeojuensis]KJV36198.1 hypothetical protein VI08_05825 [Luteibacter yeojuensis]